MVLEDLDPGLLLGCTTAETRVRFFTEFRRALRRLLDGPHHLARSQSSEARSTPADRVSR
ncbi:hypothetical protein [Nonomuraea guangzhouensis]|uniref:Uncharacterized protein n=1 Tax=Nonomuraea guangzhouensis TaxID=1291555 RepID=A0ABW4GF66_9ACTN|nr:hypothetical protein [Nonomuraea guangzhouensis]